MTSRGGRSGKNFSAELWQDLRYGVRVLAKSPGFALIALLTLSLGIGANAAIFQLIDAVRLRTLPVRSPNTLAIIHLNTNHWGSGNFNGPYANFTYPLWKQVEQRQEAFSSIAAWGQDQANLANGGEVENAQVLWVTGQFFGVLDIQPVLGRLISPADSPVGCGGGVDLQNLMTRNLGFRQNGVLVANVDFTRVNVPDAQRAPFVRNLLERIRAIPGVASAGASIRSPMSGSSSNDWILDKNGTHQNGMVSWEDYISPGYFATLDIPIIAGRDFNDDDTPTSPKVAIVNQTFAKKFLHGSAPPIGQVFRVWNYPGKPPRYYQVAGLVEDSVYNDMHDPMVPVMYFPHAQIEPPFVYPGVTFLIRSRGGMTGLLNSVKDSIIGVNPQIDIEFKLLRTQIRETLTQDELMATLCGFFGALAVLLAAIGLYGVISYTVAQRTNEIGIRMALGAQRSGIIRLILGEVSLLVGIGIAAGVGLTLVGGKATGSLLFGLKADDPLTLVLTVILLAAIALVASFVPARRASRLDPMVALRYE